ncbi:WD40 repeat domain-containing protein [Methanolobus profundi]|uniref:WD domain-containing protein, G-beta repeat-containing protein n=1 Tax=Methanolobus profundi TaxID=487685 RepID=A0A1I4TTW7_9EURY|nr:hypothetical protein [Methanolobus profundi]SFM80164.1 WD domain-containing protein, G-beta repeat-containing protein [Methanolobus profundi]
MTQLNEHQKKFLNYILAAIVLIGILIIIGPEYVVPQPEKVSYPYERNINCIEFSSDSKLIAVGYSESYLRVWDIENGEDIYDPEGTMEHERLMRDFGSHVSTPVISIDFSPNDEYIISGGNLDVYLWDTHNGSLLQRPISSTPANTITFSPDGKAYAYPSEKDGRTDTISIDIRDTDSAKVLNSLTSSDHAVKSLVFTPDSKYLLARYDDGKIIHWDWKNSTASSIIYTSDDLKNFDFSDDASTCAGLSEIGLVTVWNTSTGDVVDRSYSYLSLTSRSSSISSRATDLDLSSDGKYLAGSMNSELTIWDISSGKKILDVSMLNEIIRINDIEFSPDTRYLAASARLSTNEKYYFSREEFWNAINASVDSDLLLHSIGGENVVYLWDFQKLKDGNY